MRGGCSGVAEAVGELLLLLLYIIIICRENCPGGTSLGDYVRGGNVRSWTRVSGCGCGIRDMIPSS